MGKRWLRMVAAFWLVLVLGGLLGAPRAAQAVELVSGATIPADQVIDDDVFISGDEVIIDGTVNGDLFAMGGRVVLNGTVGGSAFLAGQEVVVAGTVNGSAYTAASSVALEGAARITRNLYSAHYGLNAAAGSVVGIDALLAGYQAVLLGTVQRDLRVGGVGLEIAGQVGRDVHAEVGAPGATPLNVYRPPSAPPAIAPGLRVNRSAQIGGVLYYTSSQDQSENIEAQPQGGVVYTPARQDVTERPSPALVFARWLLGRARDLLSLLVVAGLAIWLLPRFSRRVVEIGRRRVGLSFGWGAIALIVGYVGAAVLAGLVGLVALIVWLITFGGLGFLTLLILGSALAIAFALFLVAVLWGSKVVVAYIVGAWIIERLTNRERASVAGALLLGIVLLVLLRGIPFLGWVISLVATLWGLGAIVLALFGRWVAPQALEPGTARPVAPVGPAEPLAPTQPPASGEPPGPTGPPPL